MTTLSLDYLRRRAKRLRKAYEAGEPDALAQVSSTYPYIPNPMRHADFLHVIARQSGFESWPKLKFAAEQVGVDPNCTNALLRALEFNDHEAVRLLLGAGAKPDDFDVEHVGEEPPTVIPALHQAARRMNDRVMIDLLLDGGADPHVKYDGVSPYAYARVIGNHDLSEALEARGLSHPLTDQEEILADVAANKGRGGIYVDPSKLPDCYRGLLTELISLPNSLDHIKRLVAVGIEYDRPAAMGVTPVQTAGWHGLADIVEYLLELGPDLSHKNDYGGSLLNTILHGAENCDLSPNRDHVECARLALYRGVLLPKAALEWTGHQELAAFLRQWAEEKPSQVV